MIGPDERALPRKFHWTAKVRQEQLRRLYIGEAAGLLDLELLDDVGTTLLLRCLSILSVTCGIALCPRCRAQMSFAGMSTLPDTAVPCPGCGWSATWHEFHASWRHRELYGGNAVYAFSTFAREYPRARTARERFLLIDRLINAFHISLKGTISRSAGENLIEGSKRQVLRMLDEIAGTATDTRAPPSHH